VETDRLKYFKEGDGAKTTVFILKVSEDTHLCFQLFYAETILQARTMAEDKQNCKMKTSLSFRLQFSKCNSG